MSHLDITIHQFKQRSDQSTRYVVMCETHAERGCPDMACIRTRLSGNGVYQRTQGNRLPELNWQVLGMLTS